VSTAVLITHTYSDNSEGAVAAVVEAAASASVELVASSDEHHKHGATLASVPRLDELPDRPDLCLVLGGDGSILYALRRFAGTGVPVFGVNFGTVGFLAAMEREQLDDALRRAFGGEYEVVRLPGLEVGAEAEPAVALNDVSFVRRPHGRVAELSYWVAGQEVGHVRCDGLVAATPAGSTGYNLANGGPILAWGVEGFVVSFISPHSLTARALVVAPDDVLRVRNATGREPLDVALDGEHTTDLDPGEEIEVRFRDGVGCLAQIPGSTFYRRLREKFGYLARPGPQRPG
jgi:NAD+ kinase